MTMESEQLMLALNENPEPIAAPVLAGIERGAQLVNRYTFGSEPRVLTRLARYFDCPQANMVLVRGIDEAFDRLSHEFPTMRYVSAWPGFDGYISRVRVHGYDHLELGLDADFALRSEDLAKLDTNDFVFLADPSNPTGRPLSANEHRVVRERAGKVCIDQTYFDYAGEDQRPDFGGDRFVFRSFSKSFGLAGARLGLVFGDPEVIANIKRKQWFCNVGVLELHALEAALDNDDQRKRHVAATIAERERVRAALCELGLRVHPSAGNFILVQNQPHTAIDRFLHDYRIAVQDTARFGLADHVRISVGRAAENDRLLAAMAAYARASERDHDQ